MTNEARDPRMTSEKCPAQSYFTLDANEARLTRLAEILAFKAQQGDIIALRGDLGAGKSTFARAFIRAVLTDWQAEVPSPTFALRQDYGDCRLPIAHVDLYRLQSASDTDELGLAEDACERVTLIEWPDRAPKLLGDDHVDIHLETTAHDDMRRVTITGHGARAERVNRIEAIYRFLECSSFAADKRLTFLQGDASSRSYARLHDNAGSIVLMDAPRQPDGPPVRDGKPYSRIAHLAEDLRPFAAIGDALVRHGMAATRILERDLVTGLLLVEDFGDQAFGALVASGKPQRPMWLAAVDALVELRRLPSAVPLPVGDGSLYSLPRFDRAALEIETELILDWYWPAVKDDTPRAEIRDEFRALWAREIDKMLAEPPGWFLRDYHSPNLFWLPEREGVRRVGLIDFQDALAEPWAYDLVSLLQDARVDVPRELEREGFSRYCDAASAREPDFDRVAFAETYARFGLQRNTRLVGLWVRLLKRDGKPGYLKHMPRTWDYIARNLEHPALAEMLHFYYRHFPSFLRRKPIVA